MSERSEPQEYDQWRRMCEELLGKKLERGGRAPGLDELKRTYARLLPGKLHNRHIRVAATVLIPEESGLPATGVAIVERIEPINRAGRLIVVLRFNGRRVDMDAFLVWKYATLIRRIKRFR